MTEKHFVVATAGHVDHGKSALVKALTGTDPDRLPEEKAREITIDLGFAHLELPVSRNTSDGEPSSLSISIIDVPGHEDLVRNMIAGLGSIDLALLVVAADDGWMRQTEEHLQILSYVGVPRLIVAVNKTDIGRPDEVTEQIRQQLRPTSFTDAAVVPISARTGEGLSRLKETLGAVLNAMTPQRDIGKARLLIDRAFQLPGIGLIVTGTLSGGTISAGQSLYLQPGNHRIRARSLQTHRANLVTARAGMRVGINLADLPKTVSIDELRRGWMLSTRELNSTTVLDVLLEKSARLHSSDPAARPLRSGTNVHLHYGTGRIPAVLVLSGATPLQVGETAIAQLRLASPVPAFIGDRFVIRDQSEQHTIAGGVILDVEGNEKCFRRTAQQELLGARARNPGDALTCVASEIGRRGPTPIFSLLPNSNFSDAEIRATVLDLQSRDQIVIMDEIAADKATWEALRQRGITLVDRTHKQKPQEKGIDLADFRGAFADFSPQVIDTLITDLCRNGFVRRGSAIARTSHCPTLPSELEGSARAILTTLADKPLDPPARNQLAPDAGRRAALRYLLDGGEVVDLSAELVLSGEAFAQAKETVVRLIASTGSATVSELREALGTSRRVAIPLLERLDRDQVTLRQGDRRVLAQQRPLTPTR